LTDKWEAYGLAIPTDQHTACDKQSGQTSYIERFNCPKTSVTIDLIDKRLAKYL
jgi:IS1 family transposase